MGQSWKSMSMEERKSRIEPLLRAGKTNTEVALILGVAVSTLYCFMKNYMSYFSKELQSKMKAEKKKAAEDDFRESQVERIPVPWLEAVRGGVPPLLAARLFRLEYPGDLTLELIHELRSMGVCDYFIAEGFSAPVSLVRVLEKGKGRYGGRFENG